MEFEKVILSRKSCRSYKDAPVESEKLEKVIAAASLSPFGLPRDGKPHLTVVTDREVLSELGHLMGPDRDIIYGAPALIIVSCPNSREGIPEMNAACVIEMMSLMATDLGLGSIYLYGVTAAIQKNPQLMSELGIPARHTPLSALALGYGVEAMSECKELKGTLTRNDI